MGDECSQDTRKSFEDVHGVFRMLDHKSDGFYVTAAYRVLGG